MLSSAFPFFSILLFMFWRTLTAIHRWKNAFYGLDPFLVAEGSYILLQSEFCVVYDNNRQKDAEECKLTQRHLFCSCHLEIMQTSIKRA